MSEPFIAEIRIGGFNFAPRGHATCDGQLLAISQNQALFSLIGTIYGGDGRTDFALPDLRGRAPIHSANGSAGPGLTPRPIGQVGGAETHALSAAELATHNHSLPGSGDQATQTAPAGNALAGQPRRTPPFFAPANNLTTMRADSIGTTGAGAGHDNVQPFLVVNYYIAILGLFPSRN